MIHSRHFVEDSPRTRIELARNNLKMQKEIMKIEKQAKTAATNLSNNQQALRMSLRQLEGKRSSESPLLTRSARFSDKNESTVSKRKLGLFANNTSLSVESTADAYRTSAAGKRMRSMSISGSHPLEATDRPSTENSTNRTTSATDIVITRTDSDDEVFVVDPAEAAVPQHHATEHQSPYISTPFNVRRVVRQKLPKAFHSLVVSHNAGPTTQHQRPHNLLKSSRHSARDQDNINSGSTNDLCDKSSLKLPPISHTRTIISAHHNTTGNIAS